MERTKLQIARLDLAIDMFQDHLHQYLENVPIDALEGDVFEKAAEQLISTTTPLSSKETLRQRWEVAIRAEVLSLTEEEQARAKADSDAFYGRMFNILDLTMFLAEKECTEASLPFNLVRELFECLSIPSCSQVFSWVERRGKRLCLDPNKGKGPGLLVLRTLNELLRSLSKSTETEFCARILVFMNDIFPMSERSGVNLRGEYGPSWEGPPDPHEGKFTILAEAVKEEERKSGVKDEAGDVKMGEGDAVELTPEQKKALLYKTFWFMQYPFSKPPSLSEPDMFKAFQLAVNSVLPVLSEASKKERTLAGSKNVAGTKRKRETPNHQRDSKTSSSTREQHKDYAFAKYLSSPELLELEIADTNFRRQFLFQLLILLQHLRNFTETEKPKWMEPRNRSLHMDFTLADTDENWVKEVNGKVILELRLTAPDGREFEEITRVILEREQNWVKWKNGLSQSFEKAPLPEEVEEEIRVKRRQLMTPPADWKWSYGTEALTEIWEMGYRDVDNLQAFRSIPEAPSFLSDIETIEKRMAARKAQIERMIPRPEAPLQQEPDDTKPSLPPKPGAQPEGSKSGVQVSKPSPSVASFNAEKEKRFQKDQMLQNFERQKQTYSWLALRSASRKYLHLFDKIGTGDVAKLVDQINKSTTATQPEEEEANETLSDKGDGEGPSETGDVDMESQDVKMEVTDASVKGEPVEMPVVDAADESVKEEEASIAIVEPTPANAMEVDPDTPP